jgi:osmotically-inducible protein OsmY
MADDMATADLAQAEELNEAEAEQHIHMPNPSFWPILLSFAIFVTLAGLLIVNTFPWISIIGAPFVLIFLICWALENPFAPREEEAEYKGVPRTYAEAAEKGGHTVLAEMALEDAQAVADQTVTVGSLAWSAHPVQVEIEQEGVVLALYGKVELEAQKKELEQRLLKIPGVIDVKNFLVAEDALLNAVNARIEKMKKDGKLEGAKDISVQVENYIVSLYGETPTREMKYALEKEIVGIPGVRVVINHIGLNKEIPGNLGKTRNQ